MWALTSDCDGRELCGLGGALFGIAGAGVGVLSAVVVDAAVLAKEPPVPTTPRSTPSSIRASALPRREGGLDLGVIGTW